MTRHIVLGNQSLLINIDQWLQVRDLFFPHVGQYNHLMGHAHRIAILENDDASWINESSWKRKQGYLNETLITYSTASNTQKQLSLRFEENVYCEKNIFFRNITIKNTAHRARRLRICFHQDFHLYGNGIGDTALYHPKQKAIIHYKRSVYFLLSLLRKEKVQLDDYTISEEITPSWKLGKNPIAQGSVDSLLCIDLDITPLAEESLTYYLIAGTCFEEVFTLNNEFRKRGASSHIIHAEQCQRGWVEQRKVELSLVDGKIAELYKRSLLIIKTQTDRGGAILAANDSDNLQFNKDTYSYLWPRDGALVAQALIRAGFPEFVRPFFYFCRDVLYKEGCLLHKYNPDKTLGSSWHPWLFKGKFSLPIQEDETALVLVALYTYYEHTNDKEFIKELYPDLIRPMSDFLNRYQYGNGLPKESYDLWEERRAIFTYTTAAVIAGLVAAEKFGHLVKDEPFCSKCKDNFGHIKKAMIKYLYNEKKGVFRRGVSFEHGTIANDDAVDSSLYALFAFGVFEADDPKVVATMKAVKDRLWVHTSIGGLARYEGDQYHRKSGNVPGNPWFICTLWYAKWLIHIAKKKSDLDEPMELLNWAADHSLSTGIMPEQLHPHTGEPLSIAPLTWSHAEFIDTVTDYIEKLRQLNL